MNRPLEVLVWLVLLSLCPHESRSTNLKEVSEADLTSDVDALCDVVAENYYYFEHKGSDWDEACALARTDSEVAHTPPERLAVFEALLDELYDPHVNLGVNSSSSPRLVPSGTDLAIEIRDNRVWVTAVHPSSPAADAGITVGDEIVGIGALPVFEAATQRMRTGDTNDPDRVRWAVMTQLAGYHDRSRRLTIQRNDVRQAFDVEPFQPPASASLVEAKILNGSIGYIRVRNSLGVSATSAEISQFLSESDPLDGLILDLRDTPSGGNTGVAEPILGHFIPPNMAYQITRYKDGREVPAFPVETDSFYPELPVVVLVGPWTGSMGEGIAIGLHGTGRAVVLGTRMAGLAGGTEAFTLPRTKINVWLPTYDLLHVDGTPRHEFRPVLPTPENMENTIASAALRKAVTSVLELSRR